MTPAETAAFRRESLLFARVVQTGLSPRRASTAGGLRNRLRAGLAPRLLGGFGFGDLAGDAAF
jgi:hypothetical protein